jgi:hypothetical protein
MLNHAISKWDMTITPELWPFAMQHPTTIFSTMRRISRNYEESPWGRFTGEISKLEQSDMRTLLCPVFVLDRHLQEGKYHHKWKQQAEHKVYIIHLNLHHYSRSVPLIWYPKTKLILPKFNIVFDVNFETIQPPNPEIKMDDTMDRLFKTSKYKFDDHCGNDQTCLFSYVGVDIIPNSLSQDKKTCQESINTTSTAD